MSGVPLPASALELPHVRQEAKRVAVVVPIHNAATFLGKTLDSLLAQTRGGWGAILVDDASSDGSERIAAAYADRYPDRFRLIRLDRNLGVVAARNRGVAEAPDTELVLLLDHDDWLREDYLQRMLALYDEEQAKGSRVGIVGCDAMLYGPGGFEPDTWADRHGWEEDVSLDTLVRDNTVFARALFRRCAFDEVGGLDPDAAGVDEWDLWIRIVQAGYDVVVTREPLAVYRLHSASMSRNRLLMTEAKVANYCRLSSHGTLTADQQGVARRRLRHFRAVLAAARLRQALEGGRHLEALRLTLIALPQVLVATLQDPARALRAIGRICRRPFDSARSAERT